MPCLPPSGIVTLPQHKSRVIPLLVRLLEIRKYYYFLLTGLLRWGRLISVMTNTTASSTKPSLHFLLGKAGAHHFITLFMVAWDGVTTWTTPTFPSREEAMRFVKPNINTDDWFYMNSGTIEQGRKWYGLIIKDKSFEPVKP